MTPETEAELTADAVARACEVQCTDRVIFIEDFLRTFGTQAGRLPELTRRAIQAEVGEVRFVGRAEGDDLFREDSMVGTVGGSVLLTVGPVEELAPGVLGVEVGVFLGGMVAGGEVYQFMWTEGNWAPASCDETGIPCETWMS